AKNVPPPQQNSSHVRDVGRETHGDTGVWTLTTAAEPARERNGLDTTAEELRASAGAPLGPGIFQLQNLDTLRDGFMPEAYSRQRVQVKGALVRRQAGDRINVTSLEPVANSCP